MPHTRSAIHGLFSEPTNFGKFVDALPFAVAVLDTFGRVLMVNARFEALTGFHLQEILGLPCCYFFRSSVCASECPVQRSKLTGEHGKIYTADIINRSRKKIPILLTANPIIGAHGDVLGYLECFTEQKNVEDVGSQRDAMMDPENIIGLTGELRRIYKEVPAIAQTDAPILIRGETGSGKDYIAEAIHKASSRNQGPFIKVSLSAFSEQLMETELFGYVKGAFPGVQDAKDGKLTLAHNGTLFFSEITDLPLSIQGKLVTFLDEQILFPVAATKGVRVDVRIIAATKHNIELLVKERAFREDLFFRLNVMSLRLPPLKGRSEDIRAFMDTFLKKSSAKRNKNIRGIDSSAQRALMHYPFPGNIRELRNIVEFAVSICDADQIKESHLPEYVLNKNLLQEQVRSSRRNQSKVDQENVDWEATERKLIIEALKQAGGKRSRAAVLLGWARSTLWRKLKQYDIQP